MDDIAIENIETRSLDYLEDFLNEMEAEFGRSESTIPIRDRIHAQHVIASLLLASEFKCFRYIDFAIHHVMHCKNFIEVDGYTRLALASSIEFPKCDCSTTKAQAEKAIRKETALRYISINVSHGVALADACLATALSFKENGFTSLKASTLEKEYAKYSGPLKKDNAIDNQHVKKDVSLTIELLLSKHASIAGKRR